MSDDWYGVWAKYNDATAPPVDEQMFTTIAQLLGPTGRILEFGVGTWRLALPLLGRGYEVTGIDFSPAMLARLNEDARARDMNILQGDITTARADGEYDLVLAAYNVLYILNDAHKQELALRNSRPSYAPTDTSSSRTWPPKAMLAPFTHNQALGVLFVDDHPWLMLARHEPTSQKVRMRHLHFLPTGVDQYPGDVRLCEPDEFENMAGATGLKCVDLWSGWDMRP